MNCFGSWFSINLLKSLIFAKVPLVHYSIVTSSGPRRVEFTRGVGCKSIGFYFRWKIITLFNCKTFYQFFYQDITFLTGHVSVCFSKRYGLKNTTVIQINKTFKLLNYQLASKYSNLTWFPL